MTMVQLYYSELKDLFRNYLEPFHEITIVQKEIEQKRVTFAEGAKKVDISEYIAN